MEWQRQRKMANEWALDDELAPAAVEFFGTLARLEKEARDAKNIWIWQNRWPTSRCSPADPCWTWRTHTATQPLVLITAAAPPPPLSRLSSSFSSPPPRLSSYSYP